MAAAAATETAACEREFIACDEESCIIGRSAIQYSLHHAPFLNYFDPKIQFHVTGVLNPFCVLVVHFRKLCTLDGSRYMDFI